MLILKLVGRSGFSRSQTSCYKRCFYGLFYVGCSKSNLLRVLIKFLKKQIISIYTKSHVGFILRFKIVKKHTASD